jgi:hypothetical protein
MIAPEILVDLAIHGREGVDRSRMVEYFEYRGKRIAEVSLSVPKQARQFMWQHIWHDIINAPATPTPEPE